MKQIEILKKQSKAYGGELLKTRKGRSGPRPIDTKNSMHLVLRSSKAKGEWSFRHARNAKKICALSAKFAAKNGVKILSLANLGNHLHFHIKLSNRFTYRPFIRGLTAAIAMAVTGASRWRPLSDDCGSKKRFWDYRPFTRVIQSFREFLTLRHYIQINKLEGHGFERGHAKLFLAWNAPKQRFSG